MGEGEDSTGTGPASAPLCAGLPSWDRWGNGPLPEPPGGLSFDGLAVWSVVLAHPGATQREVFAHLMPSIGRRRVKQALLEGLEQGWLDLRQDPLTNAAAGRRVRAVQGDRASTRARRGEEVQGGQASTWTRLGVPAGRLSERIDGCSLPGRGARAHRAAHPHPAIRQPHCPDHTRGRRDHRRLHDDLAARPAEQLLVDVVPEPPRRCSTPARCPPPTSRRPTTSGGYRAHLRASVILPVGAVRLEPAQERHAAHDRCATSLEVRWSAPGVAGGGRRAQRSVREVASAGVSRGSYAAEFSYGCRVELGYARVSTAKQDLERQVLPLCRG